MLPPSCTPPISRLCSLPMFSCFRLGFSFYISGSWFRIKLPDKFSAIYQFSPSIPKVLHVPVWQTSGPSPVCASYIPNVQARSRYICNPPKGYLISIAIGQRHFDILFAREVCHMVISRSHQHVSHKYAPRTSQRWNSSTTFYSHCPKFIYTVSRRLTKLLRRLSLRHQNLSRWVRSGGYICSSDWKLLTCILYKGVLVRVSSLSPESSIFLARKGQTEANISSLVKGKIHPHRLL